jgi:drug/metabolite transporter (DMT)-like permease
MSLMGAGWALFSACWLPFLSVPPAAAWPYLLASVLVHVAYTLLLVPAYRRVDLSVAYPMFRGTAPVIVTLAGLAVLGETVGALGAFAVTLVTVGVVALGWSGRGGSIRTLAYGLLGGSLIATYTLLDGVGARASASAHGYAAWLFFLTGVPMLAVGVGLRRGDFLRLARPLAPRALLAGAAASTAFWIVIWALTQAPLGLVAAARETSVVFVAVLSGVLLKEKVNWLAIASVLSGVVLIRLAAA